MAPVKLSSASDGSIFKRLLLRNGVQLVLTHQPPGGSLCLCRWLELDQLACAPFSQARISRLPTIASSLQTMLPKHRLTHYPSVIYLHSIARVSGVLPGQVQLLALLHQRGQGSK